MANTLSALVFPAAEFGTPTNSAPGNVASIGSAVTISRSDHVHGREAALSPATTVGLGTSYGSSSVVGTSVNYAREDHNHGTPSLSAVAGGALTFGGTGVVGTGTVAARSDHTHTTPAAVASLAVTNNATVNASTGAVTITNSLTPTFTTATTTNLVATGSNSPTGTSFTSLAEQVRTDINLSGGGTITTSAAGAVKWTQRFIVIANGTGTHFSTNGYFDIIMPAVGATITGVGGATNVVVAADGTIPMAAWHTLYYILPIGSGSASVPGNFRIANYTGALEVPRDWTPIAMRNDDGSTVKWGTGFIQDFGGTIDTTKGFGTAQFVTLDTTQTVAAAKTWSAVQTFSSIPVVPNLSFSVAKINATGTASASTHLRGDGTWDGTIYTRLTTVEGYGARITTLEGQNLNTRITTIEGAYVNLTGAQSISGAKTFTVAPVVPDSSFTISKISATGTRDTTTFLRGDGTFAAPPAGTPAISIFPETSFDLAAAVGTSLNYARQDHTHGSPGLSGGLPTALVFGGGSGSGGGTTASRADHQHQLPNVGVQFISATGTRDATTYLRGDGIWTTPTAAAPANMVTTDTPQTILAAGAKTFAGTTNISGRLAHTPSGTVGSGVKTFHNVAVYSNDGGTVTGAIVFNFPNGFNAELTMEFMAHEYSPYEHNQFYINLYSTTGSVAHVGSKAVTVRLATGVGGIGNAVIIGDTSTTWSYPKMWLARVLHGFNTPADTHYDNVTTSLVTDLTPYAGQSVLLAKVIARAALGTGVANATTFLRGDGTWATAGGGTPATTVTSATIPNGTTVVGTSANYAREDHNHGSVGSFGGLPTAVGPFSGGSGSSSLLSRGDHGHALSATGTANSTTFLRGDNTWATPTAAAPSNMVTTDTTQTITGFKTFTNTVSVAAILATNQVGLIPVTATSGAVNQQSAPLIFQTSYYDTATATATGYTSQWNMRRSNAPSTGYNYLGLSDGLSWSFNTNGANNGIFGVASNGQHFSDTQGTDLLLRGFLRVVFGTGAAQAGLAGTNVLDTIISGSGVFINNGHLMLKNGKATAASTTHGQLFVNGSNQLAFRGANGTITVLAQP